jgi:hypothetical protein
MRSWRGHGKLPPSLICRVSESDRFVAGLKSISLFSRLRRLKWEIKKSLVEKEDPFETFVSVYQTTRHQIAEEKRHIAAKRWYRLPD